jgi:hypothetical protein
MGAGAGTGVRSAARKKTSGGPPWYGGPPDAGQRLLAHSEPNALISASSVSVSSRGTSPWATFAACT